jgi:hypothetical protein
MRLNAGGAAVSTGGATWGADQYFSGGKSYTNPSVTSIAGTTDDALYLNERSATTNLGSFSYAIPVSESGTYTAKLHFAEIYWGATGGGAGGAGKRVFSANLEGGPVELANYDINADVGPMTAVVKSYDVSVTDGTLNVAFSASVNQPTVAAIEVLKSGSTPVDTTPPTVQSTVPAAGATDVAVDTSLKAVFSEDMKASTISGTTFKLVRASDNAAVNAAVTYDASTKTATLDPSANLDADKDYTATVTTGAQDAAGNAMADTKVWSFTTAKPADTTPPDVTATVPVDGAKNVAVADNIAATFSEEMNEVSLESPGTFTLAKQGATSPVAATVAYNVANKTVTLDPASNLDQVATYTATITTQAKDVAGNPLASTETWTFSTADNTAPAAPTVRLATASDSGSSNTDNLTNDTTPTFVGQAEAASKVELFDGTSSLGTTTASNTGEWSLTAPAALSEGEHTITSTATDAANNTSNPSAGFKVNIDTTAPQTTLSASGPSGMVASKTAEFAFTSEPNASFECKLDAEGYAGCSSPKTYTNLSDGDHTFEVKATDAAGNTDASPATRTWTVDAAVPTVTGVAPAEGATGVPASTNVAATFSEAMNATTINGTTFTLIRQGTATPVAATVTYDAASKRAILNPSADLVEQATYTATLKGGTSGVKNLAGNALAADKSWSFTTDFSVPSKLSAKRSGSGSSQRIDLSWRDNSQVEAKYVIERSTTPEFTSNLVTREVGANVVTYRDTAVARNTTYYYRVFAASSAGVKSASSNVVSVVTR